MSGWVKIEKDLETDQRVRRIAKALCNGDALPRPALIVTLAHRCPCA